MHGSRGDLGQTNPSLVPLPEYCRVAVETLTYLTDLRLWKICAVASAALWCEFRDYQVPR